MAHTGDFLDPLSKEQISYGNQNIVRTIGMKHRALMISDVKISWTSANTPAQ